MLSDFFLASKQALLSMINKEKTVEEVKRDYQHRHTPLLLSNFLCLLYVQRNLFNGCDLLSVPCNQLCAKYFKTSSEDQTN